MHIIDSKRNDKDVFLHTKATLLS